MNATFSICVRCLYHIAREHVLTISKAAALMSLFVLGIGHPAQAQTARMQSAQAQKKPSATSFNLWPLAPTSEAKLLKSLRADYYVPTLKIESPKAEPPVDDPLKYLAPQNASFRGLLLYAPFRHYVPGDDADTMRRNYHEFTMRGVNVAGQIGDEETSLAVYRTQAYDRIFDPLFSEDGKRILFKVGWPFESTGRYRMYLWNMTTDTVRQLAEEDISYNDVFWSPDGNFIAYVSGGDMSGKVWGKLGKQGLRVLDVNSGKVRHVARNPGVTNMVWTHQGTLLFSMYPKHPQEEAEDRAAAEKEKKEVDEAEEEPPTPQRASIYEASAKGGQAKLLIENGYRAMPSPDGRWIAFFGLPAAPPGKRVDAVLYLYDRRSKQRIATSFGEVTAMRWTPDSRSLVIMQTDYRMTQEGAGAGTAAFRLLSASSLAVRNVAVLKAQDFEPKGGRNNTSMMFRFVRFSRDSRFLFVGVNEFTGRRNSILTVRDTLHAVALNGSGVSVVARIEDPSARVLGWDWYDETGTSSSVSTSSVSSSPRRPRENTGSTGSSSGKRNGGR